MPQTSFFHGVTVSLVDTGPRPIAIPSSSIIGLVDLFTPGDGLAAANEPVLLTSYREAAAKFGPNAPITKAAKGIYEQSSAVVVAVGVAKVEDAAQQTSAIIGSVRAMPTQWWSKPKAPSQAAQIVLLCTELKAKPNVTEISTAKRTPIQRLPSVMPRPYTSNRIG